MGLSHSPSIITNGLVFCYDMNNVQKSWKGKPTTNLQLPNVIDWSNSATVTLLAELSPIGTPVYSVTDNNSGSYLASTRSITVPNDSNTYTISIYIKKTYGATSTRLGFNSGFSGGTTVAYNQRFNSDTGVGTYGSTVDLGNWWRWQFQITNNNTGNTTLYCSFYPATGFYDSGDNSAATGTAIVSSVQIEQNTFATPFVNGSRSNTQAILDLTNNNTITATNLTYNSNGTFSFNNGYLSVPSIDFSNEQTIEIWLKPTENDSAKRNPYNQAYGGYGTWTHEPNGTINYYYGDAGSDANPRYGHTSSFTVSENEIACVCTTRNSSTSWWYKNGIQYNSYVHSFGSLAPTSANILIGTGYAGAYVGNIYLVKLYNRALSAAEIAQNFNAIRGRYGL